MTLLKKINGKKGIFLSLITAQKSKLNIVATTTIKESVEGLIRNNAQKRIKSPSPIVSSITMLRIQVSKITLVRTLIFKSVGAERL